MARLKISLSRFWRRQPKLTVPAVLGRSVSPAAMSVCQLVHVDIDARNNCSWDRAAVNLDPAGRQTMAPIGLRLQAQDQAAGSRHPYALNGLY